MAGGLSNSKDGDFPPLQQPKTNIQPLMVGLNQIKIPLLNTPKSPTTKILAPPSQTTNSIPNLEGSIAKAFQEQSPEVSVTPHIVLPSSIKARLLSKVKYVLIAKFSHGKPSYKEFRSFLNRLSLKGSCIISLFDPKHVFLNFECFEDFASLWMRKVCIINGFKARLFNWWEGFNPAVESRLAPVWIQLYGLPIFLMEEDVIIPIASSLGKLLMIDPRNLTKSKVDCLNVCVAVDVSCPSPTEIVIDFVENGKIRDTYKQKVQYENKPSYCLNCCHLGHQDGMCLKRKVSGKGADKMQIELGSQRDDAASFVKPETRKQSSHRRLATEPTAGLEKSAATDSAAPTEVLTPVSTEFGQNSTNSLEDEKKPTEMIMDENLDEVLVEDGSCEEGEIPLRSETGHTVATPLLMPAATGALSTPRSGKKGLKSGLLRENKHNSPDTPTTGSNILENKVRSGIEHPSLVEGGSSVELKLGSENKEMKDDDSWTVMRSKGVTTKNATVQSRDSGNHLAAGKNKFAALNIREDDVAGHIPEAHDRLMNVSTASSEGNSEPPGSALDVPVQRANTLENAPMAAEAYLPSSAERKQAADQLTCPSKYAIGGVNAPKEINQIPGHNKIHHLTASIELVETTVAAKTAAAEMTTQQLEQFEKISKDLSSITAPATPVRLTQVDTRPEVRTLEITTGPNNKMGQMEGMSDIQKTVHTTKNDKVEDQQSNPWLGKEERGEAKDYGYSNPCGEGISTQKRRGRPPKQKVELPFKNPNPIPRQRGRPRGRPKNF